MEVFLKKLPNVVIEERSFSIAKVLNLRILKSFPSFPGLCFIKKGEIPILSWIRITTINTGKKINVKTIAALKSETGLKYLYKLMIFYVVSFN